MGLTCSCDDFDGDGWYYFPPNDYSVLATKRSRRCCSCGDRIKPGDECVRFVRCRSPITEIEQDICGDEVELAAWFMCERCGGLYLSLDELGFCITLGDDMRDLVREYGEMQREGLGLRGEVTTVTTGPTNDPPHHRPPRHRAGRSRDRKEHAMTTDMRDNVMGRIAIAAFGMNNNRSDAECVERIERVFAAVRELVANAEEYELDCGLGRGAPNSYWEDLDAALEDDPPVSADDLRPCSACPDGYVWNSNGPTSRPCPVCGGTAVLYRNGSKVTKDEL